MSAQAPAIRRFNMKAIAMILLRLLGVAFIVVIIPIIFSMEWRNFENIFQRISSIRFITQGLITTLAVSLVAILASLPMATLLALGRLSTIRIIKWPCVAFIEVVRAVPLVLLIFYLNLRLPQMNLFALTGINGAEARTSFVGFTLEAMLSPAAVSVALALTIYTAAVNAELLRSGILSLERGQNEAARSLGLTYAQTMRRVILPQAFRRTLAPLIAQFTILVKDTSLGSIVGFFELQRAASAIGTNYYNTLEALYVVALVYFVINYLLGLTSRLVERRGPSVRVRPVEL